MCSAGFALGILVVVGSAAAHDTGQDIQWQLTAVRRGRVSSQVKITRQRGWRYIRSNGIPDHETGTFPNRNNPHRIAPQRYHLKVTTSPAPASQPTPVGMNLFGVGVNGVPFDPGAAEWWQNNPRSGWQYEALGGSVSLGLDNSNAHVQPGGAYHYHGIPEGMIRRLVRTRSMILTGYAADGYPVYSLLGHAVADDADSPVTRLRSSYRLKQGRRPGGRQGPGGTWDGAFVQDYEYVADSGDLDEFNGRHGVTPEYPNGTYYYMLTDRFPFIPRMWKGTPDASFAKRPPAQEHSGRGHHPPQGRPGQPPRGPARP